MASENRLALNREWGGTEHSKQRRQDFDLIKGIVMIFITWGHATNALFSGEIVYYFPIKLITATFAMPIFMWVSGYLSQYALKKRTLSEYLRSRFQRVFIPCILWNILIWAIMAAVKVVLKKGTIDELNIFGIWFLWALFICDILLALQVKLIKNEEAIVISSMIIWILLILIPSDQWYLAWVYPFFVLGYFSTPIIEKFQKYKWSIWLLAVAVYIIVFPFYKDDYLVYYSGSHIWNGMDLIGQLGVDFFRLFIGLLGTIIFAGLCNMYVKVSGDSKLIRMLTCIGRESMGVYVIQILILERMTTMFIRNIEPVKAILQNNYNLTCYIAGPIVTALVICICVIGIRIIRRIPNLSKFLLGER